MKTAVMFSTFLLVSAATLGAQSQATMTNQACAESQRVDAALNRVYRAVLIDYSDDTRFIARLRAAQRAWVTYRDAHVAALFPAADPQSEYGSSYSMCRCQELTTLTQARVDELQRWADGVEEGEVCAGSIATRE